ncbi:uncharacterized protein G2W53_025098 [Senna tora]|uniref:Uncharacterized protein n=1 Tax=Senna tora TaxID=362788 RepID=A0A834TCG0_9FABA|nr:uncharacterized protein G2W53_025098 [Senna tora]
MAESPTRVCNLHNVGEDDLIINFLILGKKEVTFLALRLRYTNCNIRITPSISFEDYKNLSVLMK